MARKPPGFFATMEAHVMDAGLSCLTAAASLRMAKKEARIAARLLLIHDDLMGLAKELRDQHSAG